MQKPTTYSFLSILGFSIIKEMEFQTIPRPPSQNAQKHEKLINVNKVIHRNPTLLTITKGGLFSLKTTHD
jgi:hypothetical protein